MNILSGYKTILASVGLVGLAVYQFSTAASAADYAAAWQSLMGALAAFGLRSAISKGLDGP